MNIMKEKYQNEVLPVLMKELGFTNVHQAPRISKISVNIGVGEALDNAKAIDAAVGDLETVTGQHVVVTNLPT